MTAQEVNVSTAGSAAAGRNAPLVQVGHLTRRFGDFTAVNDISFQVNHQEMFGFLGPNGAGKSTTIKMICTLLKPTSGRVFVGGHGVEDEPDAVRSAIGIVFQDNSLDSGLTARENLEFHCMMYHIPRSQRAGRIADVLDLMELTDFRDRLVKTYSGGMRRRLEIARGLLHEPQLLILDEPTVGLDPQTRHYIWEYVYNLRKQHGTTVFMTTHYMDEAEHCDRIAIIDHGEIIALDTPDRLKKQAGKSQFLLEVDQPEVAERAIKQAIPEAEIGVDGQLLTITGADVQSLMSVLGTLKEQNIQVSAFENKHPTIEDVFINLTGRRIREEEGGKDERRLTLRRMGRL